MKGNKCGHVKDSPRFYEREGRCSFFILKKACENVCKWYDEPTKYMQQLRFIRYKDSQRRSESREAIGSLLAVVFNHADLLNNHIVQCDRHKGKFDMTVQQLGKKAGLGKRRTTRAFKNLREARYIDVDYQSVFDEKTCKWIHKPAIKTINPRLFQHLGIKRKWIEKAVSYIYNKTKPFVSEAQKFATGKARAECLAFVRARIKKDKEAKETKKLGDLVTSFLH